MLLILLLSDVDIGPVLDQNSGRRDTFSVPVVDIGSSYNQVSQALLDGCIIVLVRIGILTE